MTVENSVEAILNEANVAPTEAETNISSEAAPADDQVEPQEADKTEAEDTPFPKKAVNAISRRDKQIGKIRAEKYQLQSELEALRKQYESNTQGNTQNKSPSDGTPKEDDFNSYGDYLKAIARFEARSELAEGQKKNQEQQVSAQEQRWVEERNDHIVELAEKAKSEVPDFNQVLQENVEIIGYFPPHIERVFLEADNAPMAFYALAKEGRLADLIEMSATRAAIEIGKAEDRGLAMVKQKPITKAPAPISSVKGTGSTNKRLEDMSGDDILKQLRKGN